MAYEFHYTPTGTGVISGKEVLEQTEDAINDLGNTAISGVQEALDKAEQALTNSENAVDDAQTALNTANNAEGVAIQAQNDVSNLSGTVTNIGNRVTTAEGNIGNLQGRMTTAEGNITNLQGRMTTAEGNIGNLQTAVSTAQATANSAQQTATTARQQSYVFRYSSTALTASSTNSNTLLDNIDNLKVGDKVIDSSGVLFSITAIDTQNSTFTIGTALIDLAQDSDVVHKSGDETIGGVKTFSDNITLQGTTTPVIKTISNIVQDTSAYNGSVSWVIRDKDNLNNILEYSLYKYSAKSIDWQLKLTGIDNGVSNTKGIRFTLDPVNNVANFIPIGNNTTSLGNSSTRWKDIYATNYYYGNDNVEFSTKFVTTDTAQTIVGKEFISDLFFTSAGILDVSGGRIASIYRDTNKKEVARLTGGVQSSGRSLLEMTVRDIFNNEYQTCGFGLRFQSSSVYGLIPITDNTHVIGTNNVKLKSINTNQINNLEPSSLSLPSGNLTDSIDISSYFANTSDTNSYTASANGWIYLRLGDISSCQATVYDANNNRMWGQTATGRVEQITIPILKGQTLTTEWATTSSVNVDTARFIPCQGNV